MSRICMLCGKTYQKGNLVARGIGNRVSKRTKTHCKANLRVKHFLIDGQRVKVLLCASCLKRIVKDAKDEQIATVEAAAKTAKA